ncbi:MAG: hypothetical protein R6U22_05345 [Desulfohalobiaceae bacterium]
MQSNPCSLARFEAEKIHHLEQALNFVQEEALHELALALLSFQESNLISQEEIEDILDQDAPDVLLLAFSWRMIIPEPQKRASMAWEEALADTRSSTRWKMPLIVKHLVQAGCSTGSWQPKLCLPQVCATLEHPQEKIISFISFVGQYAPGFVISGNALSAALREARIPADLENLIIECKAAGILSPKLSSFPDTGRQASPLYEINPCVFCPS